LPVQDGEVIIKDMARPISALAQVLKLFISGEATLADCAASLLAEAGLQLPAVSSQLLVQQLAAAAAKEAGLSPVLQQSGSLLIAPNCVIR
jgi:hypothetical protein